MTTPTPTSAFISAAPTPTISAGRAARANTSRWRAPAVARCASAISASSRSTSPAGRRPASTRRAASSRSRATRYRGLSGTIVMASTCAIAGTAPAAIITRQFPVGLNAAPTARAASMPSVSDSW